MNSTSLAGCSILICEDEPFDRTRDCRCLHGRRCAGSDGAVICQCLIAVENEVPSAVILDHMLSDGESSQLANGSYSETSRTCVHSGHGNLRRSLRRRGASCSRNQLILTCS